MTFVGAVPFVFVLYTTSPVAFAAVPTTGEKAFVAVNATRGGKKPCVDELTSNFADALGVVVPIPVCAFKQNEKKIKEIIISDFFMIIILSKFGEKYDNYCYY